MPGALLLHAFCACGYTSRQMVCNAVATAAIGGAMFGFGVTETVLVLVWLLLLIVPIAIAFVVGYFLMKAAVKNGVKEALRELDAERGQRELT